MSEYILAAAAIVGLAIGALAMHVYDRAGMASLEAKYATYQAQVSQVQANEARAAAQALEAQQARLEAITRENDGVIQDLNAKLASADNQRVSDRALLSSLLHDSQGRTCPAGGGVPEASGIHGPAGQDLSDEVSDILSGLAAEDADNANKLDALNQQLKPQL